MGKSIKYRLKKRTEKYYKVFKKRVTRKINKEEIEKIPVFVFGCQRSGTRVPMEVMEHSEDIISYREGEPEAFNGNNLKDLIIIKELINKSHFKFVAFKPICESHRADELLDKLENSKGLWVYRNYKDVVKSRIRKWKDGLRNITLIASENRELAGWRLGGLSREKIDLVKELYRKNLASADGHALMYYLRSSLYFDLGLDERKDIMLIRYEDAVNNPKIYFQNIFQFIGCKFNKQYAKTIYNTSVRKSRSEKINYEIERLCETVQEKLDAHHKQQGLI